MSRRMLVVCLVGLGVCGPSRADDRRSVGPKPPVALSPYAPASAYIPAGTFDQSVKPAGGAPRPAPPAPTGPVRPAAGGEYAPVPVNATPVYPNVPCADGSCDPMARLNCACGPDELGWVRAEYLYWSVKGGNTPPLAVRDVSGTPRTAVGIPGTPGQQTVLGGDGANGEFRSGFRIAGGFWLDENRLWGVSGDFFFLALGSDGGRASAPGDPPLSRPFLNLATGRPDAELVSFPGVLSGSVTVGARNTFAGAGVFLQRNLSCDFDECGNGSRLDALVGYRYLQLDDRLSVRENLLAGGAGPVPPGTQITVADRFRTENRFNGALLGLAGELRRGSWSVDARGGASFGNMRRTLTIDGTTTVLAPGQPASVRPGGLLAQPSNIGSYTSDTFAVVPEVGVNLGYQLTSHLRVHVGYTFLYLPDVWRAGDTIDRGIDPVQLRGQTSALGRPAPVLTSSGAAVQGVSFGASFRY